MVQIRSPRVPNSDPERFHRRCRGIFPGRGVFRPDPEKGLAQIPVSRRRNHHKIAGASRHVSSPGNVFRPRMDREDSSRTGGNDLQGGTRDRFPRVRPHDDYGDDAGVVPGGYPEIQGDPGGNHRDIGRGVPGADVFHPRKDVLGVRNPPAGGILLQQQRLSHLARSVRMAEIRQSSAPNGIRREWRNLGSADDGRIAWPFPDPLRRGRVPAGLPASLTKALFRNPGRDGGHGVVYIHPWEMDTRHPGGPGAVLPTSAPPHRHPENETKVGPSPSIDAVRDRRTTARGESGGFESRPVLPSAIPIVHRRTGDR